MISDRTDRDPAPLRLTLELRTDTAGVAGWMSDELGDRHAFSGWLGLVTLLDAAGARANPRTER